MTDDLTWQKHAECSKSKYRDKDLWFPEKGHHEAAKEARRICLEECPVQDECLEFAQRERITDGIFGGYGPKARWTMRRQSSINPKPHSTFYSTIVNDSKDAAIRAHERAQKVGTQAVADELGISARALYRAWEKHGLDAPMKPRRMDELTSRRLFARAKEIGVPQTATESGFKIQTLYRSWKHFGLGTPGHKDPTIYGRDHEGKFTRKESAL